LYVEAAVHTGRSLYRIPLTGSAGTAGSLRAGTPSRLSDDTRFAGAFSVSNDGNTAAFIGESATPRRTCTWRRCRQARRDRHRHRDG
jgi:hypothetical protein